MIAPLWLACVGSTPTPPLPAADPVPAPAPLGPPLPLAEGMALGDCTSVLAHAAAEAPAAPLARALCHLETGAPEQVAAELASPGDPSLEGYRHLVRARALAAMQAEGVLAELEGIVVPGAAGREVQLLRGRIRAEHGDPAARADLEPLLPTDAGPEARFWLATLAARSGQADAEQAALHEAWVDARPGGWDARAAQRLGEIGAPVPDLGTDPGRALARRRLTALSERMRTAEARELAEALAAAAPPATRAEQVLLGRVRFNARDYAGALTAWRAAYGAPEAAEGGAAELFDYALCHARTGDYDTAGVVYERVWKTYPKSKEADFASFKIGYMAWDRGNCEESAKEFAAHRLRFPESRHLDEQLWFTARCAWKAGDRAGARAGWEELEERRPQSSLVAGAAYWQARALGLDGEVTSERAGYERVLATWPTSTYAWFAAERLERRIPAVPGAPLPVWPPGYAARGEVARAELLLAVGLLGWARDELGSVPAPTDPAGKLALAGAFVRAGRFDAAKALACPLTTDAVSTHTAPVAQQLCYPRPAPEIVDRYAKGIDPSVVYGVMIAESALDPSVSSAVGARGLMQMMPEVGAGLHGRLFPSRVYDPDDLFSAPYNVALGATELSDRAQALADYLVPSGVPAVVASYNAGEDAVRKWNATKDADEWTEDIGFVETRGYVKRVLGYAMTYRWVYGDH